MKNNKKSRSVNYPDIIFRIVTMLCALIILIIMIFLFYELIASSIPSIKKYGIGFLFSKDWDPVKEKFGAFPSICGTLVSTVIAMTIAVPLSFMTAFFLVEFSHPMLSRITGQAIDLLAAIPSIIYGMWGLFVFAPFMQEHIQPFLCNKLGFIPLFKGYPMGVGMLTAGLILALMILPFMCAVIRDVFRMVPPVVKEAAYGVGCTTWEVSWNITTKYGMQGILGALFLGLGRAIGETMAVTFVIGNAQNISISLMEPGNSIASTLASQFSEAVAMPLFKSVLLELGLILFATTLAIQVIAQLWLEKVRKSMGAGL